MNAITVIWSSNDYHNHLHSVIIVHLLMVEVYILRRTVILLLVIDVSFINNAMVELFSPMIKC